MDRRTLRGGRLKSAGYDEREQLLEIEFVDGTMKTFGTVPAEIWRRLLSSPNPASFYEDRIEEEYPVRTGRAAGPAGARARLDSLFGGPKASEDSNAD